MTPPETISARHASVAGSRAPRVPAKDCEFVPPHDDLEILQLFRPNAQNHELEQPAKQHVERREHEASSVAGRWPNSTQRPIPIVFPGPAARPDPNLCTPHADLPSCVATTTNPSVP